MYGWENCDLIGETCILTKGKPLFWKDGELPQAPQGDVKKICITQINLGVMHIILLRSYSADPNYYSIVIKLVFTAQIMSSAVLRTLVFKKILVR